MYSYIKGILVEKKPTFIVLEANNIGYEIYIPTSVFDKLLDIGTEVMLYTFFYIKEDIQKLYGFLQKKVGIFLNY